MGVAQTEYATPFRAPPDPARTPAAGPAADLLQGHAFGTRSDWRYLCSPTSSLFGGAYGLSKALLNSYTLCLAREQPQLRVNSCSPGMIATDFIGSSMPW